MNENMSKLHAYFMSLPEKQRVFFEVAGKYQTSVTAQGIELYFVCREKGIDPDSVLEELRRNRKELAEKTDELHKLMKLDVSLGEGGFFGVAVSVVEIAEALFEADEAGHSVPDEELKRYLKEDFKDLRRRRDELKEETRVLLDTKSGQARDDVKGKLQAALSQLEDEFNQKVLRRARQRK